MTSGGSDQEKQRRGIAIRFGIVAAIIGVAALASLPLLSFFDAERISSLIDGAGPWGPIVFILIQIGQVFAAPIPGQITGFVGGFLFGTALGTVYATIGGTIGCSLVFILARRFGRPFVEGFVSTKITDRFDYISDHGGAWVLLLIFVVPIFPDDLICYLFGLTRILLRQLISGGVGGSNPRLSAIQTARRRRRAVESDAGGRYCSGVGGGGRSRVSSISCGGCQRRRKIAPAALDRERQPVPQRAGRFPTRRSNRGTVR